jgi:hypothetical protein
MNKHTQAAGKIGARRKRHHDYPWGYGTKYQERKVPPPPPVIHKDGGKAQTENTLPKRSAMKGGSKEVPAGAWWANARVVAGAVVRTRPNNVLLNMVLG